MQSHDKSLHTTFSINVNFIQKPIFFQSANFYTKLSKVSDRKIYPLSKWNGFRVLKCSAKFASAFSIRINYSYTSC